MDSYKWGYGSMTIDTLLITVHITDHETPERASKRAPTAPLQMAKAVTRVSQGFTQVS